MLFRQQVQAHAGKSALGMAALLLCASVALAPAVAAGIFAGMDGAWRGDGSVKWYNGESEGMRCRATNEVMEDGFKLRQTLTCANPSFGEPWRIKSNLTYRQAAGVINGSWSESNYGLSGSLTGSANASKIDAQVTTSAQNVSVRLSVVTNDGQQIVSMRVRTPEGLTEISVRMRKA
jgi:hypothetical protein